MSDKPATKRDVERAVDELAQATNNAFEQTYARMDRHEAKTDRLENGMKAILAVVQENNQLLKELRTLPERVSRLERATFR